MTEKGEEQLKRKCFSVVLAQQVCNGDWPIGLGTPQDETSGLLQEQSQLTSCLTSKRTVSW